MSSDAFCFFQLSCRHLRLFRHRYCPAVTIMKRKRKAKLYLLFFISCFWISLLYIFRGTEFFRWKRHDRNVTLCRQKLKMLSLFLILSNRTHSKCTYYFLRRKIKLKRTYTIIKIIEYGLKITPLHHVFFTVPLLSNAF